MVQDTSAESIKPKTVPAAPKSLAVTGISPSDVSLVWDKPDTDGGAPIKAYIVVMRGTDKSKFKKVGQVGADVTAITVDKVKENHDYYFRVYAENEVGIGTDGVELDTVVHVPKEEKKEVRVKEQKVEASEELVEKINENEVESSKVEEMAGVVEEKLEIRDEPKQEVSLLCYRVIKVRVLMNCVVTYTFNAGERFCVWQR